MSRTHRIRGSMKLQKATKANPKKRVRHSGQHLDLQNALGASRKFTVTQVPDGPFGVAALLDEIRTRLVSRGGRPSDLGRTIRRLVPLRKKVWSSLKSEAQALSKRGRRISPAQLAAMLVERSLSELKNADDSNPLL